MTKPSATAVSATVPRHRQRPLCVSGSRGRFSIAQRSRHGDDQAALHEQREQDDAVGDHRDTRLSTPGRGATESASATDSAPRSPAQNVRCRHGHGIGGGRIAEIASRPYTGTARVTSMITKTRPPRSRATGSKLPGGQRGADQDEEHRVEHEREQAPEPEQLRPVQPADRGAVARDDDAGDHDGHDARSVKHVGGQVAAVRDDQRGEDLQRRVLGEAQQERGPRKPTASPIDGAAGGDLDKTDDRVAERMASRSRSSPARR